MSLYVNFTDYEKVIGSVDRDTMKCLRNYQQVTPSNAT